MTEDCLSAASHQSVVLKINDRKLCKIDEWNPEWTLTVRKMMMMMMRVSSSNCEVDLRASVYSRRRGILGVGDDPLMFEENWKYLFFHDSYFVGRRKNLKDQ